MSNIKEQLKNVLEDEKRFTSMTEDKIISLIEQKHKRKSILKIQMVFGAFIIASLLLVVMLIERDPEQTSSPIEENMTQLEEQLLDTFSQMMVDQPHELLYYKVGFEEQNDAIVVYQKVGSENKIETAIFERLEEEWQLAHTAIVVAESNQNWSVNGDGPYLVTGFMSASIIDKIFVGDQEVDVINLPNSMMYYASIQEQQVNRVVVKYTDNRYERLTPNYVEPIAPIPVVVPMQHHLLIQYDHDTMTRGDEEYMKYPVVVDPSITSFNRGDVVYSDDKISKPTISRIIALPGETIEVRNGTILINGSPLEEDLGYAKIDGEYIFEAYMENNTLESVNEEEIKRIFNSNVNPVTLKANQYMMVGDNWHRSGMALSDSKSIVGKVIGYNQQAVSAEWTADEKALYEQFKQNYDVELLRNMSPITLARLYWYAYSLKDYETAYHFFTTREDRNRWSLEEHLESGRRESEVFRDNTLYYTQLAEAISGGTFIQTDATSGYIEFMLNGVKQVFQLVKNEAGIWQVAFMPMQ